MALMKCPECGKDVSDTAPSCPNCGYLLQRNVYAQPQRGHYVQTPQIKKKKPSVPIVILCVFGAIMFFCVIGTTIGQKLSEDKNNKMVQNSERVNKEDKESTEKESKTDISDDDWLADGKKKYDSGKYYYVKFEDILNNSKLLKGQKIYTVITFNSFEKNTIESKAKKKKKILLDVGERVDYYRAKINKEDKAVVLGKVSNTKGNKISIKNGYIVDIGEKTKEYEKKQSDEKFKEYILKNIEELSEDDYKQYCKELWHDDIFFSKDNLEGEYVRLQIFLEESRFLEEKDMLRDTVQELKDEYDIQRDFYACGVSRGEENSYVNGQIYIYFSNNYDYKAIDYDQGQELIVWGKIVKYSKNNWTGYNNCIVIPKYIKIK